MDIEEKTFTVGFERTGTWRMKDRMKGTHNCPTLVLGTSNPQQGWVKNKIHDPWQKGKLKKKWHYIRSRVYDNPHISEEWIQTQKDNLPALRYRMMMDGDWDVDLNSELFFYEFRADQHIIEESPGIDENETLWMSLDFNFNPVTGLFAQKDDIRKEVTLLDCLQVKGGTEAFCEQVADRYRDYDLMVTGDFSGNQNRSNSTVTDWENRAKVF